MPAALPHKGKVNGSRQVDDGAALRGATLAFGAKPAVKPKPVIKNYSGTNGALAAAMKVGTHLQPPQSHRSNSDSHIAANLAASRSSSISPMNTGQRCQVSPARQPPLFSPTLPRSSSTSSTASNTREYGQNLDAPSGTTYGRQKKVPQVHQVSKPAERGSNDHALDTTPIPPTNKLISIFEDKSPPRDDVSGPAAKPPYLQTKSQNRGGSSQSSSSQGYEKSNSLAVRPTPKSPKPISYIVPATTQELRRRSSVRSRQRNSTVHAQSQEESSSDDSFVSATDFKENEIQRVVSPKTIQKPIPPPPRGRIKRDMPPEDRGRRQSAHEMQFHGLSLPKTRTKRNTLVEHGGRRSSVPDMEYHGAFVPHLTGDSLANAVAAGSLASSRAASPSRGPSIPPRIGKHSLLHQQRLHDSRTPSPAKGLRKTMRNPHKESEEDEQTERRGKKKLLNKHPNKHAEGDRKRWRDEITERERKRYEAVWASNKGLFLVSPNNSQSNIPDPNPASNANLNPTELVSNIAVRDIWKRSRLGSDVLEEVWELVNRTQPFALTREEFVVGLWLIDQRLKGRKLPIKVSESVWGSASRVRVIPPKRKR